MDTSARIMTFEVSGFKSFNRAKIVLYPLTLLIGPNASGKSNLVEALRLLRWLATGQRLDQVARAQEDGTLAIRGRVLDLPQSGQATFSLGCRLKYRDESLGPLPDRFELTLRADATGLSVLHESVGDLISGIAGGRLPMYEVAEPAHPPGHEIVVQWNTLRDQGTIPPEDPDTATGEPVPCTDQQLVLTQLRTPAVFAPAGTRGGNQITERAGTFAETMSRIFFLDPVPRNMRGYAPRSSGPLKEDGANLSGVLFDLCQAQGKKADVLRFVRELPEEDLRDIKFIKTDRGDVMVRTTESFGGQPRDWDAPVLSDGTLRVLAIAAALLSVPESSIVVIEEIDSGIHPSRAKALLQDIREVAKRRNLGVLLTSHNPALLDGLPPEVVSRVACCFRDPTDGFSRLLHLIDLPQYPELIAQGSLGWLATRGMLERSLKDQRGPEQRKQEALEWLAGLDKG